MQVATGHPLPLQLMSQAVSRQPQIRKDHHAASAAQVMGFLSHGLPRSSSSLSDGIFPNTTTIYFGGPPFMQTPICFGLFWIVSAETPEAFPKMKAIEVG